MGTQISIAVNVENSPAFNGFDIFVKADQSIINPTFIDTSGNSFQSAGGTLFIASECINNQSIIGNCFSPNANGVARLSAASNIMITGGHLFTINYTITGSSPSSPIAFQSGCANTSNDSVCVTLVSASTVIPENLQTAVFNSTAPRPDFTVNASPTSLSVTQGSCATSSITVASVGGFTGPVSLSSSASPAGPLTSVSPTSVTLSPSSSATATLSACTTSSTSTGSYTVTATGSNGLLFHSATISLMVMGPPDFVIGISPSSQIVPRAGSTSFTVTLTSLNGFAGTISLSATISPTVHHGPTIMFSPASVSLSSGAAQTSTLTVSTSRNTPTGTYTVTVTATNGALSHSVTVTVTIMR